MSDSTTTLYAVYNADPAPPSPDVGTPLPVLQRLADVGHSGQLAIYDDRDAAEHQLQRQREEYGDHIDLAELEVTDWSATNGGA